MMKGVIINILRMIINRSKRVSDSVSGSACSAISKHSSKSERTKKCFVFISSFHFLLIEPALQDNRKQLGWDDAIALVAPTC